MKQARTNVVRGDDDRNLPLDRGLRPVHDLSVYFREYARERPEVVAMTCFGIGFVLGWKLKPW